MGAQLIIQGINFTDFTEGLNDLQITYAMGDSKLMGISVSNELLLTGDAHNYIHENFFADPCTGKFTRLAANIIFDCCDENDTLSFVIDYGGVKVSDLDCETKLNLKSLSLLQKGYEYLRDTPYFYNGFPNDFTVTKLPYVIQRKNFEVLFWLMVILYPALYVLEILEQVVLIIARRLSSLVGWLGRLIGISNGGWIGQLLNLGIGLIDLPSLDNYLNYLTGAGNYHFAPYFSDIFAHNITTANAIGGSNFVLDFELLESAPYSDLSLFQAEAKGYWTNNTQAKFNYKAVYDRTLIQLLEEIEPIFRLKSGITPSGTFIIATENRFHDKATKIFNAESKFVNGFSEEAPIYNFIEKPIINISSLSYTEDSTDLESKFKMFPEYSEDVVHGNFIGGDKIELKFPFGPARFMFDSETAIKDNWYDNDLMVDELRTGELRGRIPLFNDNWNNVGNLPRKRDLIMSEHTCDLPKLLIIKNGSADPDTAEVPRISISDQDSQAVHEFFKYNFQMHLDSTAGYLELYQRFHYVDAPDSLEDRIIEMDDFTVCLDSDIFNAIKLNGLFVGIECKYGKATPEEITINLNNCTVTFKGLKYKCKP